ncbi:mitochondrial carrier homolog 2 isoform X2 [Ptiloglossa arizonensis]|uniref:mitochondrial carrier homolog 2 isoform X2 n=1 Tax=Ptiloglossa arizonensis TaxID=3350558 RepID=UPI003FA02972
MIPLEDNHLPIIGWRLLISTVTHPFEYAKVLIQIGHEPIPPRPTSTLFGQPALALPNIFQYARHIAKVDKFHGCYRGLIPQLCASTISNFAYDKTFSKLTCVICDDEIYEVDDDAADSKSCRKYVLEFIRDLISRTIAIIVTHPLDVIALRMMAQFVGRETKYNGLFRSFVEVYKQNGIMGYYAGLVPRLIGNAAILILISSSTYIVDKYITTDNDIKPVVVSSIKFIATTITYPFLLVSHCMAVNNCGLVAGLPPHMPIYKNWQDCWSHLSATNQLKRGNSLICRYYTGPSVVKNGTMMPIAK